MALLNISEVLKTGSTATLALLYAQVNDHRLDPEHVNVVYEMDGESIKAHVTARVLTENMFPGRYKGTTTLRYRREALQVLFNGVPTFFLSQGWPVSFKELQQHLLNTYGVLVETRDVFVQGGVTELSPTYLFQKVDYVNKEHTIELRISDLSPRFIPHSLGGAAFVIRVIDPNGADLEYIGPNKLLTPVTSLDG